MKTKTIVSTALLAFVAASLGWLFFGPGLAGSEKPEPEPSPLEGNTAIIPGPGQPALSNRVIVYYFHTTNRCPTCHKIEDYTKEAVQAGFAQALREGRVEFKALNIEDPANTHFMQDYQLHTKSVVVVDIRDGRQARWKNLTRVWELVGSRDGFFKYIQDEVNLYLQGG